MRDGRILAEGLPNVLMTRYDQNSLEDVFLYLCEHGDKSIANYDNDNDSYVYYKDSHDQPSEEKETLPFEITTTNNSGKDNPNFVASSSKWNNFILNFWILGVLVRKNLGRFFQFNISFIVFLLPAVSLTLLCFLYSAEKIPVCLGFFIHSKLPVI